MNLFVLHEDVEQSVQWHVDDHVNKIALEALQVMSTALFFRGTEAVAYDASTWYKNGMWGHESRKLLPRAYAPTHIGHPMARWCQDPVNYTWTLWYVVALCKEHRHRKGTIIQQWQVVSQMPRFDVPRDAVPETFYAAVADELMTAEELARGKMVSIHRAVELYRQYYIHHKAHLHRWSNRSQPEWIGSHKLT